MTFEEFEAAAWEAWDEIPAGYREGVDGLIVRPDAPSHPDHPGVFTLGECLTEEHVSDFGSAETTRSLIALYWGSFGALAAKDPDFDWDGEVWETLTHELRHHLESLAGDDALEDVDRASDETFRRFEGQEFNPWYYQDGDEVARGVYRVEKAWYVEQTLDDRTFGGLSSIHFTWNDTRYRIPRPDELGDVHFILVEGIDIGGGTLEVVLLRRRSWVEAVKRLAGLGEVIVLESVTKAEPAPPEG